MRQRPSNEMKGLPEPEQRQDGGGKKTNKHNCCDDNHEHGLRLLSLFRHGDADNGDQDPEEGTLRTRLSLLWGRRWRERLHRLDYSNTTEVSSFEFQVSSWRNARQQDGWSQQELSLLHRGDHRFRVKTPNLKTTFRYEEFSTGIFNECKLIQQTAAQVHLSCGG